MSPSFLEEQRVAASRLASNIAACSSIQFDENVTEQFEQTAVEFAHPSDWEFARALDSYRIAWRYKPRTFAIEWDEQGNLVDAFTPDFFLPQFDQYVELVAPDQRLTEKNRYVRLLRRHEPEINIKLICISDYGWLIGDLLRLAYRSAEAGHLIDEH